MYMSFIRRFVLGFDDIILTGTLPTILIPEYLSDYQKKKY